jgi:hypothetical protein
VFSDNAPPFEAKKAYSPFAIYTLLTHDSDFTAAAKDLSAQGYGSHNGNPHPAGAIETTAQARREGTHPSPPGGNGRWNKRQRIFSIGGRR